MRLETEQARRWPELAATVMGAVGAFSVLLLFAPPSYAPDPNLDASWVSALEYFFSHRFRAGLDYIYTFGPLGGLFGQAYDRDVFWAKYAWELFVKGGAVIWLVTRLTRGRALLLRALSLLVLTYLFRVIPSDPIYILASTLIGVELLRRISWRLEAVLGLFLVLISLSKFTFFAQACALMAVVVVHRALSARPFAAARLVALIAVELVAVWTLLGQPLAGLPLFVRGSWVVASHYSEALSAWGDHRDVVKAAVILLAYFGLFLSVIRERGLRARESSVVVLLSLACLLVWKEGFVRHDLHCVDFFAFMAVLSVLLPFLFAGLSWVKYGRAVVPWLGVLLGVWGFFQAGRVYFQPLAMLRAWPETLAANGRALLQPLSHRAELEKKLAASQARNALPRVQAQVGDHPIDLVSFEQGYLFLNRLRYRPRPLFQGFAAVTPELQSLNRRFLAGGNGPDYLLLKVQSIDGHFPTSDEGLAWLAILEHFAPAFSEHGFLLLKRRPVLPAPVELTSILKREVTLGEEVPLPNHKALQFLSLDLRPTLLGKLFNVLYKSPPVHLQVTTEDGRRSQFRIVPSQVRGGFLVNPPVLATTDLEALYAGRPVSKVRSVSVTVPDRAWWFFRPGLTFELREPAAFSGLGTVSR